MPVPWQENVKSSSKLKEIQTPETPSVSDTIAKSDTAKNELEVSRKGIKNTGSRLTDLRENADRIDKQVSIMNKKVWRYSDAQENSTDV